MEITVSSTKETKELAQRLAKKLRPGNTLALYGDLGSGKTTFTRYLTEILGFESRVQSPTFIIIRHYQKENGDIKRIYHIDLYRLNSKEEVEDLGLTELFADPEAIAVIEWPELLEDLPEDTIKIYFEYLEENSRKIKIDE